MRKAQGKQAECTVDCSGETYTHISFIYISVFKNSFRCGLAVITEWIIGEHRRFRARKRKYKILDTGMLTHPVWIILKDSASCGIKLLVSWSGSGLLVLLTQPLETLVTAERHRGINNAE